jgi:hypothetical protein
MKFTHRIQYTIKERRSILIAFLLCILILPDPLFALSLYLKDHILDRSGSVLLEDIALLRESSSDYNKKVVIRNLDHPLYLKAEDLKGRLLHNQIPVKNIYGRGVWIIPLQKQLTDIQISALIKNEIDKRKTGAKFLRDFLIYPVSGQEVFAVPGNRNMRFRIPDDLTGIREGRRVMPLDVISDDGAGKRRVIYRQNVTFRIQSRNSAELKGKVPAGDGSWKKDNTGEIVVRKGDSVFAVYSGKSVLMSIKGKSVQNGRPGEIISVKLLFPSGKSSDDIKARVISEGVVQIEK